MQSFTYRLATSIALVACAACSSKEPNYCANAPHHNCMDLDAGIDGPTACTSDQQCSGATAVCDITGTMVCVQCTASESQACTGMTPTCGSDDKCRACSAHADCASDACLPDGSCGTDSNVAYVDAAGSASNTTCTKAAPCSTIAKALATAKAFVKIHGTVDEQVSINNQNVTLLADQGAKLTSTSNGILLEVKGTSQVSVYDLQISGASGTNGYGVSMPTGNTATLSISRAKIDTNSAGGVSGSAGTLTIARTEISGNAGGGVSLSSTSFDLENNFIVQNGGPTSLVGGINLATVSGSGSHRLDFNTIAANAGTSTVNSGVNCGTVGAPIVFSNNLIYGNTVSGGGKQIGGSANCTTTYSDVGPDAATGTGNINMDPMFVNAAQGDFHITAGSPAKDAADPAATLDIDIDGDSRPQGSGRDIGADEFKP
jgi:hypothetical protein